MEPFHNVAANETGFSGDNLRNAKETVKAMFSADGALLSQSAKANTSEKE